MAGVDADLAHLDAAMAARIMARRQTELARRERLLNAKRRVLGCDLDGLGAQVAEKQVERAAEHAGDGDDRLQAQYLDTVCTLQERKAAEDRTAEEKELKEFNRKFLRKELRKEYWLSDPDQLKREKPLSGDEVDALGPSAILSFGGHSEPPDHKKEKEEYIRAHLNAQIAEKMAEREMELEMERQYADGQAKANMLRLYIEQKQAVEAKEDTIAVERDNVALAKDVQQRRKEKKEKEEAAKQAELEYNKSSQLLNEAEFLTGPDGRVLPDTFKRMTRDQVQAILDEQAYQMIEKRQRMEAEREDERQYAQELELQRECVDAIEQEKQRRAQAKRDKYAAGYREDARIQARNQQELGKVYVNQIDDSFYKQFGRSAR